MPPIVILAWRNVLRNRRRTLITVGTITFSLAAVLLVWSVLAGSNRQAIDSSTGYLTGHLQLSAKGFFAQPGFLHTLRDLADITTGLAQEPAVKAIAPRVEGLVLISYANQLRGIVVLGIDPRVESKVTKLQSVITTGRYLNSEDRHAVLLSQTVAKQLNVALEEEIILVGESADGSLAVGKFRVVGIFNTYNHDIDSVFCLIPLVAAQELFELRGQLTGLAILTHQYDNFGAIADRLKIKYDHKYDLRTWEALLPSVAQSVAFHEAFSYLPLAIILTLVAIGVTNTMLMSVLERTPEWGLILALGASPSRLLYLVLLEGLLLGAIGLPLGCLLALLPVAYLYHKGIDLSMISHGLEAFPAHAVTVHPTLTPGVMVFVSGLILCVVLLATLYPALKVSRLSPVETLRNLQQIPKNIPGHQASMATRGSKWIFWYIAWRNVARNPGRSLLIASASALGIASMIFLYALLDGFFAQIVDNSTGYLTGHIQVGKTDFYRREPTVDQLVDNPQAVERLLQHTAFKNWFTWRVDIAAIVSTAESSQGIRLLGIEPSREEHVTFLKKVIKDGKYLEPGDDNGIILGRELAKRLQVNLHGKVVVTSQDAEGNLVAGAYRLRGIFETGSEAFDAHLAFISYPAAARLLGLSNEVSVFVVRLEDRKDAPALLQAVNKDLDGTDLEAIAWEALLPETEQILAMSQAVFAIILTIAFGVTALGSMNAILMSVMERKREIGTLVALGTSPSQIVRLVVYESSTVVLCGVLAGLVGGALLTVHYGMQGIDFSSYIRSLGRVPGMTSVVYPKFVTSHAGVATVALLLLNTLTSLYPAWKAANMNPVANLRAL